MSDLSETRSLHHLARLYGVQTAYYDMFGHRCETSVEALLAVLRSLGAPMATVQDIPSAWRERRQAMWQQKLEPIVVAWDGKPLQLKLRLPSHMSEVSLTGHLTQEGGERQSWEWHGADLPSLGEAEVEGTGYIRKRLPLPERLPWGYHRFTLELAGEAVESLIIAAPFKAYSPPDQLSNQAWGVFLPYMPFIPAGVGVVVTSQIWRLL